MIYNKFPVIFFAVLVSLALSQVSPAAPKETVRKAITPPSDAQNFARIAQFMASGYKNTMAKIHEKLQLVTLEDRSLDDKDAKTLAMMLIQIGLMPGDPVDDQALREFLDKYFSENNYAVDKTSAYSILWSHINRGEFLYSLVYPNDLSLDLLDSMMDPYLYQLGAYIDEKVVPYKKARVDIFKSGSIHGIGTEYSAVSVEDKLVAIGSISTSTVTEPHDHPTRSHSLHQYVNTPDGPYKIVLTERYLENPAHDKMPFGFMLSWGDVGMEESGRGFHGTVGYGKGSFGDAASHGCIRECDGYEALVWKTLNPSGLGSSFYTGGANAEALTAYASLLVMREKVSIHAYSKKGLQENPELKAELEEYYSKDTVWSAVKKNKYKDFSANN